LIARYRAGVITRAAPAPVDRRACRLLLDTDAGSLKEIHLLSAKNYWCEPWAFGHYRPRLGLTNPNQSDTSWTSFTQHTNKNRVQPSGSDLLAVADRRALSDCPRVWYRRNQTSDMCYISVERDSNAALCRRNYRV
jgi:hypothetical protein